MASIERERNEENAAQFMSSEQKARLDEVIKQAELSLQSDEVPNQSIAVVAENECPDKAVAAELNIITVTGALENLTKGPLAIYWKHQYAGYVVKDYTDPLDSGVEGGFSMAGRSDEGGVAAAVVYSGKNDIGDQECGLLLGFCTTKVYVLCGPIGWFNNLSWEEIKTKIERRGQIDYYFDRNTGTQIYAAIAAGRSSGRYSVSVAFYG